MRDDGFGTICFLSVDLKEEYKTAIEVYILTIMAIEIAKYDQLNVNGKICARKANP